MKQVILFLTAVVTCAVPQAVQAQVIPTSEWINLWSDDTTLNTNPVPVGASVRVYDPDGVLCGDGQVDARGSYGLVAVYRDDPFTPVVDEGAEPGDTLRMTINGFPARAIGPDVAVWTHTGDVLRVNLSAQGVVPTSEWASFWSDDTIVADSPVTPGAVVRAYDAGGVLCGETVVVSSGNYGLMPVYRDDPTTPDFDEGADPGDALTFRIDYVEALPQGPDAPLWSANGDVKNVDLRVELVPTLLVASHLHTVDGTVEIEWTLGSPIEPHRLTILRRGTPGATGEELTGISIHRHGTNYRAVDGDVEAGVTYIYQLRISASEGLEFVELGTVRVDAPRFALLPNYPNPFGRGTTIRFDLGRSADVALGIYDAAGHSVRQFYSGEVLPVGDHEVLWDGRDHSGSVVSVGVYFVRFRAAGFRQVRKVTIIR
jgi:hypothetical protein